MRPLGEIQGFGFHLTDTQRQTIDDGWRGVPTGVPTTVPSWPPGQMWYYRDPQGITKDRSSCRGCVRPSGLKGSCCADSGRNPTSTKKSFPTRLYPTRWHPHPNTFDQCALTRACGGGGGWRVQLQAWLSCDKPGFNDLLRVWQSTQHRQEAVTLRVRLNSLSSACSSRSIRSARNTNSVEGEAP